MSGEPAVQFTDEQLEAYRAVMAANQSKGGIAAAKAMTPEQRKERAKKAARARWARRSV